MHSIRRRHHTLRRARGLSGHESRRRATSRQCRPYACRFSRFADYTTLMSKASTKDSLPIPGSVERPRFRQRLLNWYRRHGRDLPWRKTSDPYHILVSEIMLQQTQVDRVLPKYAEWLEKSPTLQALAAAPEREVNETWYPLGYNIRARRLHTIARESVSRYGGPLPADEE